MPASCDEVTWLQLCANSTKHSIVHTRLLEQLTQQFPTAAEQFPSITLFVGSSHKRRALRHILSVPAGRTRPEPKHTINIRLHSKTALDKYPLFVADADPENFDFKETSSSTPTEDKYPISWNPPDAKQTLDILIARLLLPFVDVVCFSTSDFTDARSILDYLKVWARLSQKSHWPHHGSPQVLLINEDSNVAESDLLDLAYGDGLDAAWTVIKTVTVSTKPKTRRASYAEATTKLLGMAETARNARVKGKLLFSATHLTALFNAAVHHFSRTINEPFDFILATRCRGPDSELSISEHIEHIYSIAATANVPAKVVCLVLSSSLAMQALPPGAHMFNAPQLFRRLFRPSLLYAFSRLATDQLNSEALYNEVSEQFCLFLEKLGDTFPDRTLAAFHRDKIMENVRHWSIMQSDHTCLCCSIRPSEHAHACGHSHSLCEQCVRTYGEDCSAEIGRFDTLRLQSCLICGDRSELLATLKPLTAGVRLLSIDGGGIKGIVELKTLGLLQALLGDTVAIQDMFDLVLGTSAGGLIALKVFLQGASIRKSTGVFREFSRKIFGNQPASASTLMTILGKILKTIFKDGLYDDALLDEILQEQFGTAKLFSHASQAIFGTKVGVTATAVNRNTSAPVRVFANYNGSGHRRCHSGYRLQRSADCKKEPLVWQAARATSAAPGFFRPAVTSFGAFWDGCAYHNNPTNLARWESRVLWPKLHRPDVVVNLGTGSRRVTSSPIASTPKLSMRDSFPFRVINSWWDSMDGESVWQHICNQLDDDERSDYFRLSLQYPGQEPAMYDHEAMDSLAHAVTIQPNGDQERRAALLALLISCFFFELTAMPRYQDSRFYCEGTIRCRTAGAVIALLKLWPHGLEFFKNDSSLGCFVESTDICESCGGYARPIQFFVASLEEPVKICLKWDGLQQTRLISAMPKSMLWYSDLQGFTDSFGTKTHGVFSRKACAGCSDRPLVAGQKRKRQESGVSWPKRPRQARR